MSERSELQAALDALFTKEEVASRPTMYIINRFMAWQPELAPFSAALSRIKDDDMAWEIWKTSLPRAAASPKLFYPAPRSKRDEELVKAMEQAHPELGTESARAAVALAETAGVRLDMMETYGIEDDDG